MKYDFDKVTDRTHTNAVKYDLAEKWHKPKDAVSLWVADMDFPTAPCISKAIAERTEHGIYGYSMPDERYFGAIRNWFSTRHDWNIQDEWIVNTPGVVFAFNTAIRAFTREGDGILITQPVYYPFFNSIKAHGRRVVNSPLSPDFQIDFEDFEKKIVDENVKMFMFCSPHNPGGKVWSRDDVRRVSEICLKHNVLVISDEIHCDITFNGAKHTVYATISKEAEQNCVICTAASKTFNLAGLQFSNIFIPNPELRNRYREELDRTGYDEGSLMGLLATTAAYQDGGEWFDQLRKYIWGNIQFTVEYLKEHLPAVKVRVPEGTYLVWLDFTALDCTDEEIEDRMISKAKVWLDGGSMFGPEGKKYQRINVATPRSILEEALKRICREFN